MVASRVLVKEYFDLFVNRRAYTVQSFRPHPESGYHHYHKGVVSSPTISYSPCWRRNVQRPRTVFTAAPRKKNPLHRNIRFMRTHSCGRGDDAATQQADV
jgi:hypothetical protein